MTNSEHRRHSRKAITVEFRVRDAEEPQGGELLFDTADISEGGAFLASDLLLEPGDELEVDFALPNCDRAITAKAKVVWVTRRPDTKGQAGMGLEFTDLEEADRKAITDFVS